MDYARDTADLLAQLTDKQKEVLDLLVRHKTSKQIARELGISPHTVDQRIAAARRKFDVETRNDLAEAYMAAQLQGGDATIYERPVYQSPQVETDDRSGEEGPGSDAVPSGDDMAPIAPGEQSDRAKAIVYHRVVPEFFEGRFGFFWRLTAIVGITLGLLISTLVGLAIYGELSELMQ